MSSLAESPATELPRLRVAVLEDYEKIRRLASKHALDFPQFEDWRDLWLGNPLAERLGRRSPIGWVLEAPTGEIVGNFGTVSSLYKFRGDDLVSTAGRFWFVAAQYRGLAFELMDEYLNQPGVDLFVNNAVSAAAFEAFSFLFSRIPLGVWDVMSYWRVAECRRFTKTTSPFAIEISTNFDSRFDCFWRELVRQNPKRLIAERSTRALSWHFAIPMRKRRLWICTASRSGILRAYCILVRQAMPFGLPPLPKGAAGHLRSIRLVDYQSIESETDLLPDLIEPVLARCAGERFDILEHFGCGVPKMGAADESAPYRKKLTNWKFFYRAVDARLEEELREPRRWDPSAYDGETSFE